MQQPCIVACARSYLGTPFKHQGRSKDRGVDCLGLLVGIARDCELKSGEQRLADRDDRGYGHIPPYSRLHQGLCENLTEISKENMRAGDVVLLRHDGNPQHLGIIAQLDDGVWSIIHAYAKARKVVEHRLDDGWYARIAHIYRFCAS
ncbi:MAG: NlpC/P60 family protein [Rickettsiales bacterium]|nr:NlpC/P60 family protein [Rickettsiales bacterium]